MKKSLMVLLLVLGCAVLSYGQQTRSMESAEETELWQIYQQISDLKAADQEVPQSLYDRYFELDRLVHPEQYGRYESSPLDQLTDTCPGGEIMGPDSGQTYTFSTTGATNTATNNCSAPNCRLGRDLFIRLNVAYRDSVTITTCGSAFDTYLCIFQGGCCGQQGSTLWASNDNAPEVCGIATTLQAGISRCFEPGVYYICLDGFGPAAFGLYRFSMIFHGNSCIPPINEPECPADYSVHEEGSPEGCDAFANIAHCGEGWCGQIDSPGDLDVYMLEVTGCERQVVISVYADDTPGRTGYEGGLNSMLRVWPVTCEAPLSENDDFNGSPGAPIGTDSRVTVNLVPGTYFFEITGSQATSGPYEMFVSCSNCDQ